ncbi:MAG: ethanolamine ammonia-lyase subunit EutC [Bacillota bacterium]|nr:ethanolamine ammonia-lyase subunit EutC [Bacillota bacterium]MDP4159121.1 ethanolamine ammonia-lyase subunit EutC [Bacillota bacterium]
MTAEGNGQLETLIIQSVLEELSKNGLFDSKNKQQVVNSAVQVINSAASVPITPLIPEDEETVTLPTDEIMVDNPFNLEAIRAMKKTTPARIGIGRAGARQKTVSWLRFLADHAVAKDAVFVDVSEDFLKRMNLVAVTSAAQDKEQFLTNPELGRRLSEEGVRIIKEKCSKNPQVQICVVDGLSSSAIEANIPDLLPALIQGLNSIGLKIGTPVFIKHGRVWVQDQVAKLVDAEVVISLIGERPGLGTAESLSAYMIYRPNENTVEADRTVISNIHKGGIPPAEAGAHLVDVLEQILKVKVSGVKLNQK